MAPWAAPQRLGLSGRLYATAALLLLAIAIIAGEAVRFATEIAAAQDHAEWSRAAARSVATHVVAVALFAGAAGVIGMALVHSLAARLGRTVTALRDTTTELTHRDAALRLRFDAALDNIAQGLLMVDSRLNVVVFNAPFLTMFGLDPAAVHAGMPVRALLQLSLAAGNHPGRTIEDLLSELRDRTVPGQDTGFREVLPGRVLAGRWESMGDGGWVCTYEDVTERQRSVATITRMERHDTLTDLLNRTTLTEEVRRALGRARRGEDFALLCINLDRFKQVNDTLGHQTGDAVLKLAALRLRGMVREVDAVARLGGDVFAVVQAGAAQPESAVALAARIIEVLSAPYEVAGTIVVVGVSVGIALATREDVDVDLLLRNADLAMHRAKQDGGGAWRFFEPQMDAVAQARRALELDLRVALERGEFELYYQPLVSIRDRSVCAFEALLRWHHPVRGMVAPDTFIPLAEEIGLIVPIGEWVLHTACATATLWPEAIRVAVNLSSVQFTRPLASGADLVEQVGAALAQSGLPASRLELEITESVLLQDNAVTLDMLHRLRDLGVRISLDDFGTGYSSLSYLRSFPFDKLKIDKSFIRGLTKTGESDAIVRAIAGLGASLGISTTAEGVETLQQLERLVAEGCTEVQGFFFSPPRPATEVPRLLGHHIPEPAQNAA